MQSKAEFHARVWAKLLRHERAHRLLSPGDRVLVAVSGGPDSVCLADFLARTAPRRGFQLRLVHFHHGLRQSADHDASFVESLGRRLALPVRVERLRVLGFARRERRSVEDAGRALRYRALARLAHRFGANKVATGHQLDDQAETVLLHLLRGTRAEGLAGIPVRRPLARGVEVVRPLLCLTRAEVRLYLRYRGLASREDPTNRSRRFLRNWVRLELLPRLESRTGGLRERLAVLAADVGRLSAPRVQRSARASVGVRARSEGRGEAVSRSRPKPAASARGLGRSRAHPRRAR